jgi:hypothetical protein
MCRSISGASLRVDLEERIHPSSLIATERLEGQAFDSALRQALHRPREALERCIAGRKDLLRPQSLAGGFDQRQGAIALESEGSNSFPEGT